MFWVGFFAGATVWTTFGYVLRVLMEDSDGR